MFSKRSLAILFSILIIMLIAGFGVHFLFAQASSIVPTNLIVTPGDPCVAPLQPTLSWDLTIQDWLLDGYAWSANIGWIKFKGTSQNGSPFGVKIDALGGNFSGYAWSPRIGWVAFGDYNGDGAINASDENISGAPCSGNCRAKLNLSNNQVSGWARALSYQSSGGDRGWIKLAGTAQNGSSYGVFYNQNAKQLEGWAWGAENIGWIHFNGPTYVVSVKIPTQSAYQIQVDSNSGFPFPTLVDTGKVSSASRTYTVSSGVLSFGATYYWRVKIWDEENSESAWTNGPSFATVSHQYPNVNFEWTPKGPSALETIEFKDKSAVYGGTTIASWLWTFQDAVCKVPLVGCENVKNPKVIFQSAGAKSVSLKVTDSDGFSCTLNKSVPVNVPLPEIKEVAPKEGQ